MTRLWLAVFSGYMALGATVQALPAHVVDHFHSGPVLAGTAVGTAFLATTCVRPFAGRLADAGLSRRVAAVGAALCLVGGVGHLVAPDAVTLLVARLVMGAGEAALFSGSLPRVMTGVPADRRGRVAGWFGLSMWGGLTTGPIVAVALADRVWWGVITLSALALALVMSTSKVQYRAPLAGVRDLVPPAARVPGTVLGLAAYGYGTISALMVLRLTPIGGQNAALALYAAGFLLIRAIGSPLVDRYGGRVIASGSLVVETIGLTVVAWASTAPLALFGGIVAGIGVGLVYPATIAMTLDRADTAKPGAAMGSMTSFWDLGIMAAGPLGGVIAAGASYPLAFTTAAVATATGLAVAWLAPTRTRVNVK